jgi:hypothetical protein
MKKIAVLIFSMLLTFNVFGLPAHTFHTSLTRIDYNEKEKLAEISIQLFTHDLVPSLERFAKKSVDLEKTPDVDKIILQYLEANFVLTDKKGEKRKLRWVGKEHKVETFYVYIEIPLEEDFDGYKLQNTIFFESFPQQANMVVARFGGKKADLLFKSGEREKLIAPKTETEKSLAEN